MCDEILGFPCLQSMTIRNEVKRNPTAGITASDVSVGAVGLLPGPTIQEDINYLGQIYNLNNGINVFTSGSVGPADTIIGNWTTPSSFYYNTDPNFDPVSGLYTGDGSRYFFSVVINYSQSGAANSNILAIEDIIIPKRLNQINISSLPVATGMSAVLTFESIIPAGHTVGVEIVTFTGSTISYTKLSLNIRKIM
jgi:hypothetical protein